MRREDPVDRTVFAMAEEEKTFTRAPGAGHDAVFERGQDRDRGRARPS